MWTLSLSKKSLIAFAVLCISFSITYATTHYYKKINQKEIQLTLRNVSFPEKDPGEKYLNEYWQRRERKARIPLQQMAIILVDVWETKNERLTPDSVTDNIVKSKIAPLLEVARKTNLTVIYAVHRPIGWDGINSQPVLDYRGPSSSGRDQLPEWVDMEKVPPEQWPPIEFIFRVGEYKQFAKNSDPLYMPYTQVLGIHPAILPVKREFEYIESSLKKVHEILRKNEILHLFYVGGATNMCIVQRPVGIRRMSSLGYNTIILRDATWGSELPDTWDTFDVTKAAILDIEINNGFSALSEELVTQLKKFIN